MENEIIYLEINNWICGNDYPNAEPFKSWLHDDLNQTLRSDEWCKKNNLCVTHEIVDMSNNYKITANKDWVMKNCPCLLDEENMKFVYHLNEEDYDKEESEYFEGSGYGEGPYLKWCKENFGCHHYLNSWDEEILDSEDEDK